MSGHVLNVPEVVDFPNDFDDFPKDSFWSVRNEGEGGQRPGVGVTDARDVLEDLLHIDVGEFYRRGRPVTEGPITKVSQLDECEWTVTVTVDEDEVSVECSLLSRGVVAAADVYELGVSWAACNRGGYRPYFHCPRCARRVKKLYFPDVHACCRACTGLRHRSQREQPQERLLARINDIRIRLGGQPGLDQPIPPKPKHMHWTTYDALQTELRRLERKYLDAIERAMNLYENRMAQWQQLRDARKLAWARSAFGDKESFRQEISDAGSYDFLVSWLESEM